MSLHAAILFLVTVFVGNAGPVRIRHFRPKPDERARSLTNTFETVGHYHNVPSRLLLAVAYSESGLDSNAVGDLGEVSLMQFLPGGAPYRAYQTLCSPRVGHENCDYYAVAIAADELSLLRERCGSWGEAIGAYKSGQCIEGPKVRYVLSLWRWLEEVSGGQMP